MKSRKYARVAYKVGLLFGACCLFYFLSTGPAVLWWMKTDSRSIKDGLELYLMPIFAIEEAVFDESDFNLHQQNQSTVFHKFLSSYVSIYGDEARDGYEVLFWKHHYSNKAASTERAFF